MSKPIRYGFAAAALLLLIGVAITSFRSSDAPGEHSISAEPPRYPLQRTLRYSFTVQNNTGQQLKGATFNIFAPVKRTSFQRAGVLSASHPYELVVDDRGNQRLRFALDFPPHGSKVVSITARVALSDTANSLPGEGADDYLQPEKYIEVDDPSISDLSARFAAADPLQRLRESYAWVAENIAYAGYIEDDRGAIYALEHRRGDCTEYMYLFTALARAQRVPTRGVGGYIVAEDALLKARDFHNWAEIYVDNQWRIVDPQHKKFLQTEHHYIAMRLLAKGAEGSIGNTHGFSYGDENLDLKMN